MRIDRLIRGIDGSVPVRPEALPRHYPGGSRGVLLIHGFSGNPEEMDYLGRTLNSRGFTVSIPRLPGHGTGGSDFRRSGAIQWLRHSMDAYLDLRSRLGPGGTVDVAGLSMGGLLALILAAVYRPGRLVLAAPALKVRSALFPLTPFLKYFVLHRKRRSLADPGEEIPADGELPGESEALYYSRYTPTAQTAELYRLQRLARSLLPEITAPCLTLVSRQDRTVPVDVLSLLEKRGGFARLESEILEESGHVLVNQSEKERVARRIQAFLED